MCYKEMMRVQVLKRDGSLEPFAAKKIVRVVKAAGLEPPQAVALGKRLDDWVGSLGKKQLSSLEIRDQVLAELRRVNAHVANLFEWYEKTKDHDHKNTS